MLIRSIIVLVASAWLAACSDAPPADQADGVERGAAPAQPAPTPATPPADRPAPQPIRSGTPLPGGWDPDIMKVELAGERLTIFDAKHAWPLTLGQSSFDFTRQGLAGFGTPVLSHSIAECPAGQLDYLDYANGLQLAFQDGKLVGYWVKDGARGIATVGGIRAGSPLSALGNAPVREASFGKLVTVDGTTAILDEQTGKISDLYAGLACIFD